MQHLGKVSALLLNVGEIGAIEQSELTSLTRHLLEYPTPEIEEIALIVNDLLNNSRNEKGTHVLRGNLLSNSSAARVIRALALSYPNIRSEIPKQVKAFIDKDRSEPHTRKFDLGIIVGLFEVSNDDSFDDGDYQEFDDALLDLLHFSTGRGYFSGFGVYAYPGLASRLSTAVAKVVDRIFKHPAEVIRLNNRLAIRRILEPIHARSDHFSSPGDEISLERVLAREFCFKIFHHLSENQQRSAVIGWL